jgi:hypothetical protein
LKSQWKEAHKKMEGNGNFNFECSIHIYSMYQTDNCKAPNLQALTSELNRMRGNAIRGNFRSATPPRYGPWE